MLLFLLRCPVPWLYQCSARSCISVSECCTLSVQLLVSSSECLRTSPSHCPHAVSPQSAQTPSVLGSTVLRLSLSHNPFVRGPTVSQDPTNTAREGLEDPLSFLYTALHLGTSHLFHDKLDLSRTEPLSLSKRTTPICSLTFLLGFPKLGLGGPAGQPLLPTHRATQNSTDTHKCLQAITVSIILINRVFPNSLMPIWHWVIFWSPQQPSEYCFYSHLHVRVTKA